MNSKKIKLLAFILWTSTSAAFCQFSFKTYGLHRVHVVDVIEKKILEHQTVVIHNDRIFGIYASEDVRESDTLELLNYKGYFLSPGLIDAHVHLATDPSSGDNLEITKSRLRQLLRCGVTTVRDMAGDARYLSFLARQTHLDEIRGPDIYYSALLAGPGFFRDPRTTQAAKGFAPGEAPWMQAIDASADLDLIVQRALGTGASGLKIYANLDGTAIKRIVDAAHRQNMKVWAHASVFPARPSEVCAADVDVLSHATYLAWEGQSELPNDASHRHRKHQTFDIANSVYADLVECMEDRQAILDATLMTYGKYFPDSTLFNYGVSLTRLAYENDVKIGVGTDVYLDQIAPAPIFEEMSILQQVVGMQPIDVIRGATIVNAEMLGKEDLIGSVSVGKKANLVLLPTNPLEDVNYFREVEVVIKNGKLISPK